MLCNICFSTDIIIANNYSQATIHLFFGKLNNKKKNIENTTWD